jgi:putative ABC transport system permease protein
VSNLSRAYRVNLTVLALVALFTGAFLVFSVLALSVARRAQQFALLGVLGLDARQRLRLVLAESAALGVVGSAAGIALGTLLAHLALRCWAATWAAATSKACAALHWSTPAAVGYGVLGVVPRWSAAGSRRAGRAAAAGADAQGPGPAVPRGGAALDRLAACWRCRRAGPAAADRRHAAGRVRVGGLLAGGRHHRVAAGGRPLYDRLAPLLAHRLLPLLAVERARRVRERRPWRSAAWSRPSAWRWR